MATTGIAWDLTNPKKPFTEFDVNDQLDYPLDYTDFLTETGATIAIVSVVIPVTTPANPMKTLSNATIAAGLKQLVRIAVDSGVYVEATHLNKKFPLTFRMTDSNGQIKDRTLWFKLVEE